MSRSDYGRRSDQFDIRLNVPEDADLDAIVKRVDDVFATGVIRYVHVSGVEIGDVPGRTSYGERHVHITLILNNYTSKQSIIRKFVVNKEHGWYVEPRDKKRSLHGWIDYHAKVRTKVDPNVPFVLQYGALPSRS